MAKFIKYGDRQIDMGDLTLDQAKQVMARHFPELAEPKVDTQKRDNGDVVYVFTKNAGRKGAGGTAAQVGYTEMDVVVTRLLAIERKPVIEPAVVRTARELLAVDELGLPIERLYRAARRLDKAPGQAEACARAGAALLDLPPQGSPAGSIL